MENEALFWKLSERDYNNSPADQYAQLLQTIFLHLATREEEVEVFLGMLKKADAEGKRVAVKNPFVDFICLEDLIIE